MTAYQVHQTQFVPADIDRVWDFFSSPRNLNQITPSFMNFEIIDTGGAEKMFNGQLIKYKVSPFPFYRVTWITEIKDIKHKISFVDTQKKGPFKLWHHEHKFSQVKGGVEMTDHVTYALPFGFLGNIAHAVAVKRQVKQIFDYRRIEVEKLFAR